MHPLKIHLRVKFRFMFVDWGTVERTLTPDMLPGIVPEVIRAYLMNIPGTFKHVFVNERGVLLEVSA